MHEEDSIKQVLVVRKDLNMRKGKMVAQGAHGATKVFFDRGRVVEVPENAEAPYELRIPMTAEMYKWVKGIFTKIVVAVNSEEELLELKKRAEELKVPVALIEDNGLTEFHGVLTKTVLAIGPDKSSKIDLLTGNLTLL